MTSIDTRLRVVIVNYNGGALLGRAVDSVNGSDWLGPLDVVIVDNASTDGSLEVLQGVPGVSIIRRDTNEGFGANNYGFVDVLGGDMLVDVPRPDLVALLNPDAMVRKTTFRLLAEALDPSNGIVVAAPKILFDRPFVELLVSDGDLTITEVRRGDVDLTAQCHEIGAAFRLPGPANPIWRCHAGTGLRVPSPRLGEEMTITFASGSDGVMSGSRISGRGTVTIETAALPTVNVVQNAGSELDHRGNGHNRGFGDVDGRRSYTSRPPAWCGAAAMLHADYLSDVGGFEPSYFLYYEDVDVSLRGIARGWSTVYVPAAVVEHRHSDSASQGTELVEVYQHRNRIIMLLRNAPLAMGLGQLARAFATPASLALSALRQPRLARAYLRLASWRLKAAVRATRRAPRAVLSRRAIRRNRQIPAKRVMEVSATHR
jgi:GT2 family glycosyltransferase